MSAKTPLILLPGLLCDEALWIHQAAALADMAHITVPDLTGHDYMPAMARSVLEAAPDTFALAGLSMGGYLAQEIVRQAPDRVSRLALLDTSARADTPEQTRRRRLLIRLARRGEFKGVTERLLPLLIHQDRLAEADLKRTIMDMATRIGRDAFLRQQAAIMTRPDGRHDLALIHCPTLILCGRQDALTPLDRHQEMAAKIPHSALTVVEECGHLAPLERPDAVTDALRTWLSPELFVAGDGAIR